MFKVQNHHNHGDTTQSILENHHDSIWVVGSNQIQNENTEVHTLGDIIIPVVCTQMCIAVLYNSIQVDLSGGE